MSSSCKPTGPLHCCLQCTLVVAVTTGTGLLLLLETMDGLGTTSFHTSRSLKNGLLPLITTTLRANSIQGIIHLSGLLQTA